VFILTGVSFFFAKLNFTAQKKTIGRRTKNYLHEAANILDKRLNFTKGNSNQICPSLLLNATINAAPLAEYQ